MNLENVTVELRPRTEWEGAELGVRMVRRDAAAIYVVWFAVTLPLLTVAALLIAFGVPGTLALICYWWLEPVADGPVLRIVARRLFGEQPDVRSTLRAVPGLAWRNRIFLLPPYRFHFARSTAMPLTQLESLSGPARRLRARVLNQRIMNHGTGLTVAYQHLALCLQFGALLLVFLLVPPVSRDTTIWVWFEGLVMTTDSTRDVVTLAIFYLAQTALQPWFVGAGFGLYINCRTQLEAWDLEVAFRRLVLRRAPAAGAAAVLLLCILPALPGAPARAEAVDENDEAEYTEEDPGFAGFWGEEEVAPALERAYTHPHLDVWAERATWQALNPREDEASESRTPWGRFFEGLAVALGWIIEAGLWLLLGVLAALLVFTRSTWLPFLRRFRDVDAPRPVVRLADGEITAESLPADLPAAVRALWEDGRKRDALGLLYRGSVFAAVRRHGVRLPPGATEGACVAAVDAQAAAPAAGYFRRVVAVWIALAYGAIEPADDVVLPLCADWPQHLGASS